MGGSAYIDALGVFEPALQNPEDSVRLQIHNQHTAPREHPKRALPQSGVLPLGHTKRLRLQGVPRPASLHGVIREVRDGVDGLATDDRGRFVGQGVEEETLDVGEGT